MSINRNNIGFVIRLISVLIIASLTTTSAASPSLSNSGGGSWQYQKDITISNTGGALSDYQVLVSLMGVDFPTNAQTSGADIRFTDASGTELSYWIESWDYSGRTAKIWVKVTSIASGSTTIRMYYGNPSATGMSNGDGTFVFFDDFSGAVLSSKWTISVSPEGRGTVTISSGMLNLIANPTPGSSGTWSKGEFAQVKSTASFPLPYKLVFRYSTNLPYPFTYIDTGLPGKAECYHLGGMSDYPATAIQPITDNGGVSNGIMHMYSQNAGDPRLLTVSTSTPTRTNFNLQPNVFKTFEFRADSSSVKFVSDGTVITSHSTNIPTTSLPIMFEASQAPSGKSRCGYYDVTIPSEYHVDYVFLAKYASSEPTVTLGAEQAIVPPTTVPPTTIPPTTVPPTTVPPTPPPAFTPTIPIPTPTPQCPPAGTYLACKYIDQSGYIELYSLNVGKTVDKIDLAGEVKTQWSRDGFGFRIEADGVEIKSFRNTGPFTLAQTVSVNKYVGVLKVYGYTEGYAPKDANGNPTSGWVTSTHILTKLQPYYSTPPPTTVPLISWGGYVYDIQGNYPIKGAVVEINGPISKTNKTNIKGEYKFENLPSGLYTIKISADDYYTKTETAEVVMSIKKDIGLTPLSVFTQPKPTDRHPLFGITYGTLNKENVSSDSINFPLVGSFERYVHVLPLEAANEIQLKFNNKIKKIIIIDVRAYPCRYFGGDVECLATDDALKMIDVFSLMKDLGLSKSIFEAVKEIIKYFVQNETQNKALEIYNYLTFGIVYREDYVDVYHIENGNWKYINLVPLFGPPEPFATPPVTPVATQVIPITSTPTPKPPLLPDLVITDISWTPTVVKNGDKVTISFVIKNQGGSEARGTGPATAPMIPVELSIDGEHITTDFVLPLDASGTRGSQSEGWFKDPWKAKSGSHKVCVKADYSLLTGVNGEVAEEREDNNQMCKELTVKGGGILDWLWDLFR